MGKKESKEKKESLLHIAFKAAISAAIVAIVGGFVGYKINSHLPELFYQVTPTKVGHLYYYDIQVMNLGAGPATELNIRYSFNKQIKSLEYDYSEGLGGKLPKDNVLGGIGENEVLFSVPRLMPNDILKASFIFEEQTKEPMVKIFSKEASGRPYVEWKERLSGWEQFVHRATVIINSLAYQIQRIRVTIPKLKQLTSV